MANYQHGYCYGILDENGKFVYVGSSLSLSPEKRFARHHTHANISLDSPLHRMMAGALHRMRWQLIVLEAMEPRGAAEPTADLSVESAAEDCRAATLAVAARTDRSDRVSGAVISTALLGISAESLLY